MSQQDLVLSVRFTADGKGLVEVVGQGADSLDRFDKATDKSSRAARDAARANDQLGKSAKQLNGIYTTLASTLISVGAGYLGFQKSRELIDAFEQQEQAVAALDQSIFSMGRTTEGLSEQLRVLASQIQGNGVIGDEAIIKGQSFLTTYSAITDDLLPRTSVLMADIAAKMKGDVVGAANLLGKASMGMTGELARMGITLSDTAKETKDFELILTEIEAQVGGMNTALASTATGGITQFENAWGDVEEQLGQILAIGVSDYLRDMAGDLAISEERVQALGEALHDALAVGGAGVAGLAAIISARLLGSMAAWSVATVRQATATTGLSAALGAQTKQVTAATAAMALYSAGAARLSGVLTLMGGPVGLIAGVATALAVYVSSTRSAAEETDRMTTSAARMNGALANVSKMGVSKQIDETKTKIAELEAAIAGYENNIAKLRQRSDAGAAVGIAFNRDKIEQEKLALLELQQELKELEATKKRIANLNSKPSAGTTAEDDSLANLLSSLEQQRNALSMNKSELIVYNAALAVAKAENKSLAVEVLKSAQMLADAQAANDEASAAARAKARAQSNYDGLVQSLMDEETALNESFVRKAEIITEWQLAEEGRELEAKERMLQLEQWYVDEKTRIQQAGMSADQRIWETGWMGKLSITTRVMGSIASLLMAGNKKQFDEGKKLARASIAISTAAAVMKAKDNPWPLNVALVAEALALGGLQLRNVNSTSYGGGSVSTSTGGSAGLGSAMAPPAPPMPAANDGAGQADRQGLTQIFVIGNTVYGQDDFEQMTVEAIQNASSNRGVQLLSEDSADYIAIKEQLRAEMAA